MSNINHRKSVDNKRNVIMVLIALGLLALSFGLFVAYRHYTTSDTQLKIVRLSSLHPVYGSVQELVASPDATLVAEAVVADDGRVIASPRDGDSTAPPRVSTVHQIELGRTIKGHDDSNMVTISLMGGIFDKTEYVVEGVPKLRKGDRIVFFASRGDDGKYYPLSGSTAVARIDNSGYFTLTNATISGEKRSFTIQDLEKMTK